MKPVLALILLTLAISTSTLLASDWMYELQSDAVRTKSSRAAHWGTNPERYSRWTSHSNRLIPVYTYGTAGAGANIDLNDYIGEKSVYRDEERLQRLYQGPASDSVADDAVYMDQTNIFDLQLAALEAGKKHFFLVVFDGMDWQTTAAAAQLSGPP